MQKIREVLSVEILEATIKHNRGSSISSSYSYESVLDNNVSDKRLSLPHGPLLSPPLPTALPRVLMKEGPTVHLDSVGLLFFQFYVNKTATN